MDMRIWAIIVAIIGATLWSGVVQAHETGHKHSHPATVTWQRVDVIPTPKAAEMWHKAFDGRVCIVSLNVQGAVHAVLLRDMHGNMAVGIEAASRDYFHTECGDLPPA